MFEETIVDQNPHWSGDTYIEGVPRKILNKVIDYLDLPHIISIVSQLCGSLHAGCNNPGSNQCRTTATIEPFAYACPLYRFSYLTCK